MSGEATVQEVRFAPVVPSLKIPPRGEPQTQSLGSGSGSGRGPKSSERSLAHSAHSASSSSLSPPSSAENRNHVVEAGSKVVKPGVVIPTLRLGGTGKRRVSSEDLNRPNSARSTGTQDSSGRQNSSLPNSARTPRSGGSSRYMSSYVPHSEAICHRIPQSARKPGEESHVRPILSARGESSEMERYRSRLQKVESENRQLREKVQKANAEKEQFRLKEKLTQSKLSDAEAKIQDQKSSLTKSEKNLQTLKKQSIRGKTKEGKEGQKGQGPTDMVKVLAKAREDTANKQRETQRRLDKERQENTRLKAEMAELRNSARSANNDRPWESPRPGSGSGRGSGRDRPAGLPSSASGSALHGQLAESDSLDRTILSELSSLQELVKRARKATR